MSSPPSSALQQSSTESSRAQHLELSSKPSTLYMHQRVQTFLNSVNLRRRFEPPTGLPTGQFSGESPSQAQPGVGAAQGRPRPNRRSAPLARSPAQRAAEVRGEA